MPDQHEESESPEDNGTGRVMRLHTTGPFVVPRKIESHLAHPMKTLPAIATSLVRTVSVPEVRVP